MPALLCPRGTQGKTLPLASPGTQAPRLASVLASFLPFLVFWGLAMAVQSLSLGGLLPQAQPQPPAPSSPHLCQGPLCLLTEALPPPGVAPDTGSLFLNRSAGTNLSDLSVLCLLPSLPESTPVDEGSN